MKKIFTRFLGNDEDRSETSTTGGTETPTKVPTPTITDKDLNNAEKYKSLSAEFSSSSFGMAKTFTTDYTGLPYYPEKGSHPRIFFSSNDVEQLYANLYEEENSNIFANFLVLANTTVTGVFDTSANVTNIQYDVLKAIEAKAYWYAMTKNPSYGYQAIYAIKNVILTANTAPDLMDHWRQYSKIVELSACVYDWCYDLMTDTDKEQLFNGVMSKCLSQMDMGYPPTGEHGVISGHDLECQFFRGYLSFAIAVYDEYPYLYDFVAGRLFNEFVPAQNYFLQAGRHWESAMYGPFRLGYLMEAQILMSRMTAGKCELFNKNDLERCCNTFIAYLLNNNKRFQIGDGSSGTLLDYYGLMFWASSYFNDGRMKSFATSIDLCKKDYNWITPVRLLSMLNPGVEVIDVYQDRPLVTATDWPSTLMIARNAWNSDNTWAVYMNMSEYIGGDHIHSEIGSFQIYYKGMLACDTGVYGGNPHRHAYDMQTIASNSLLIYNVDIPDTLTWNQIPYSGGQSLLGPWERLPSTLEMAKHDDYYRATVTGKAYDADSETIKFAYLAGDMTAAYDAKTVELVTRDMLTVATDDPNYPMVFVTYDRIKAVAAEYKKTYLLHSKTNPTVTNDDFVIITNYDKLDSKGNNGKLVVQSCITDMTCNVFGGNGEEYTINGTNYSPSGYDSANAEYRIELNPVVAQADDRLLTVMYVAEATNEAAYVKAAELATEQLMGAVIFNKAMLFAKSETKLSKSFTFSTEGSETLDYYVAGVNAGTWVVSVNDQEVETITVTKDEGIMTFTAEAGEVIVRPH